ncbi:EsaB/YukD family protein [Kitasatospora purpeofusca]|uniref:EsaB/YukD family protein n=1 Tax=Kitasatospora purpeofusca TaxID=67352 RepID=UPI0036B35D58
MTEQNPIPVVLATTMVTEQWDLELPVTVLVQSIIVKLIATPGMPFREQDDDGRRVPYRLMWREGDRVLNETETLASAGVRPNDTLVMTRQARAGQGADAR